MKFWNEERLYNWLEEVLIADLQGRALLFGYLHGLLANPAPVTMTSPIQRMHTTRARKQWKLQEPRGKGNEANETLGSPQLS